MQTKSCPTCGSRRIEKVRGLRGAAEHVSFALLLLCGVIPGIIYYFYIHSLPYCLRCRRRFQPSELHTLP